MQEISVWSDDPKDPRWRFRVVEAVDEAGLVEIYEETTTSTAATAQTADVLNHLVMTPSHLRRLHAALSAIMAGMPPEPPAAAEVPRG